MNLKQSERLVILLLYVLSIFSACKFALGVWFPPTSSSGLWFYSGLAALLLGNLLVAPYFTKPADAVADTVSALVALLAVNLNQVAGASSFDRFLWTCAVVYSASVLVASVLSIVLKDSKTTAIQQFSQTCFLYGTKLGTPTQVFSVVFLFSVVTFHRHVPREYIVITLTWILVIALKPLETLLVLFKQSWALWHSDAHLDRFGVVVGYETPSITLIKTDDNVEFQFSDMLLSRGDDGKPALSMALDHMGYAEGRWVRALQLPLSASDLKTLSQAAPLQLLENSSVFRMDGAVPEPLQRTPAIQRRDMLIGLVAPDSDIADIQVEILRQDIGLEEGALVEVHIGSLSVLYQIVNGLTKEEILQEKNRRGFVRALARKIGRWNDTKKCFEQVKWVPRPNEPVFLVKNAAAVTEKSVVGHCPGTTYGVSVDLDHLVTHNTAILGILGVGKSFLSLELIERLILKGVAVICFDLTNQYAAELAPYIDAADMTARIATLQKIGPAGKTNTQGNVEDGGSIIAFAAAVKKELGELLAPGSKRKVLIVNPASFEVWRQDSKPFSGKAAMASLTPTEITRIFTESALEVLQAQGMTDLARCCLVYEEAHSLIPEWNSIADEGDKSATNGTAKAILQGRKFGLGCIAITQRTANITKSVLNQCNTVFALRIYDATGVDFLKNYIGEGFAAVLSRLDDRQAILFGKASSCKDPILLRLNDRDKFIEGVRPKPAWAAAS